MLTVRKATLATLWVAALVGLATVQLSQLQMEMIHFVLNPPLVEITGNNGVPGSAFPMGLVREIAIVISCGSNM